MEILFWIVCVSMLVGFGTGVLIGYLLAYWSMNGQTGCPEEPMRVDRAMETEGVSTTSQSFEFSHAEMASSYQALATRLLIRLVMEGPSRI